MSGITDRTVSLVHVFAGTSSALIVLNLGLLIGRAVLRLQQRVKLKLEDWLLNIAFVCGPSPHLLPSRH